MIDSRTFRDAFGAFPTGVAVVTAAGPDGPVGLTTNALTSVSLEPPLFLVCFARTSRTLPVVVGAGELAVSILRSHQDELASRFASKFDHREKFDGVGVEMVAGVPAIGDAAAIVTGAIEQVWPAGDHEIVLCRATAVRHDGSAEPLIFHRGGFGELADELAAAPQPRAAG